MNVTPPPTHTPTPFFWPLLLRCYCSQAQKADVFLDGCVVTRVGRRASYSDVELFRRKVAVR